MQLFFGRRAWWFPSYRGDGEADFMATRALRRWMGTCVALKRTRETSGFQGFQQKPVRPQNTSVENDRWNCNFPWFLRSYRIASDVALFATNKHIWCWKLFIVSSNKFQFSIAFFCRICKFVSFGFLVLSSEFWLLTSHTFQIHFQKKKLLHNKILILLVYV